MPNCNTLQHTATHCDTLQHMQHTATHCNTLQHMQHMQHTATHCNTALRTRVLNSQDAYFECPPYHPSTIDGEGEVEEVEGEGGEGNGGEEEEKGGGEGGIEHRTSSIELRRTVEGGRGEGGGEEMLSTQNEREALRLLDTLLREQYPEVHTNDLYTT